VWVLASKLIELLDNQRWIMKNGQGTTLSLHRMKRQTVARDLYIETRAEEESIIAA
jgi:hypothetical protein